MLPSIRRAGRFPRPPARHRENRSGRRAVSRKASCTSWPEPNRASTAARCAACRRRFACSPATALVPIATPCPEWSVTYMAQVRRAMAKRFERRPSCGTLHQEPLHRRGPKQYRGPRPDRRKSPPAAIDARNNQVDRQARACPSDRNPAGRSYSWPIAGWRPSARSRVPRPTGPAPAREPAR